MLDAVILQASCRVFKSLDGLAMASWPRARPPYPNVLQDICLIQMFFQEQSVLRHFPPSIDFIYQCWSGNNAILYRLLGLKQELAKTGQDLSSSWSGSIENKYYKNDDVESTIGSRVLKSSRESFPSVRPNPKASFVFASSFSFFFELSYSYVCRIAWIFPWLLWFLGKTQEEKNSTSHEYWVTLHRILLVISPKGTLSLEMTAPKGALLLLFLALAVDISPQTLFFFFFIFCSLRPGASPRAVSPPPLPPVGASVPDLPPLGVPVTDWG